MHKRLIMAAALVVVAANGTSAWAGWGCGYNSDQGVARVWALDSEAAAREGAMTNCDRAHLTGCRIISCSANVDSQADADKIWPRTGGIKYQQMGKCGGDGQPPCRSRD